jgi:hypothetical protein
MTKKEKIRMATQIADAEIIIMTSSNSEEVRQAKDKVINLTNKIDSFTDLDDIQELTLVYVQDKKKKLGL